MSWLLTNSWWKGRDSLGIDRVIPGMPVTAHVYASIGDTRLPLMEGECLLWTHIHVDSVRPADAYVPQYIGTLFSAPTYYSNFYWSIVSIKSFALDSKYQHFLSNTLQNVKRMKINVCEMMAFLCGRQWVRPYIEIQGKRSYEKCMSCTCGCQRYMATHESADDILKYTFQKTFVYGYFAEVLFEGANIQ